VPKIIQSGARRCDVFHVYYYRKPSHPRAPPCTKFYGGTECHPVRSVPQELAKKWQYQWKQCVRLLWTGKIGWTIVTKQIQGLFNQTSYFIVSPEIFSWFISERPWFIGKWPHHNTRSILVPPYQLSHYFFMFLQQFICEVARTNKQAFHTYKYPIWFIIIHLYKWTKTQSMTLEWLINLIRFLFSRKFICFNVPHFNCETSYKVLSMLRLWINHWE
jgi:hypothetical protein